MLYYLYWGVIVPWHGVKKREQENVLNHIKVAYFLTGAATVYILGMLLYFLYTHMANSFATLFMQTSGIMLGVGVIFVVGNYFAFMKYEKERICG